MVVQTERVLRDTGIVTDDPGSKPDQIYAWRRDRQNYMGRIKEKKFACTIQGISERFEHLLLWPPRSPNLTPCDFFLWGIR